MSFLYYLNQKFLFNCLHKSSFFIVIVVELIGFNYGITLLISKMNWTKIRTLMNGFF
jgi:hypothetical protein